MYNFKEIEKKWQNKWESEETFKVTEDKSKKKFYMLVEFPYPSGAGLHVGHARCFTASDVQARFKRSKGLNVLFPFGFDSFGNPAEQYAIKNHEHPSIMTHKCINVFRSQAKSLGLSVDWSREISTCEPEYYKWTQWQFIKFFNAGLAYKDEKEINWCPKCKMGLSNEDSQGGKCVRCDTPVEKKLKNQWMLKMKDYSEKLIDGLKDTEILDKVKTAQINWIGKSVGAHVDFNIKEINEKITVFTTRCDTLFGATFMVISPEHPILSKYEDKINNISEVKEYQKEARSKSDIERTDMTKEKTGVKIDGLTAINPINNKEIPIYISDYVLMGYGTGAIMAVPAHDTRDYEFAKKFGIEIIPVLEGGNIEEEAYTEDGVHINSEWLNGLGKQEAIDKMVDWLQEHHCGQKKVSYKLRDWLFSRQRYWGEPIPIVHMEDGTMRTVPVEELPLELPATKNFQPHDSGESPLANCEDWLEVEIDGQKGRRETNTMPQWAGSCWYYIRYIDPHNSEQICDPKLLDKWLPVDLYVGGAEHAVLHLLYSRFWHKVLYDCGVVKCKEPWQRLVHQGMILGDNNEKMSKSRGNVVNPDDIVASHGADSLRLYEMFMGPLEASLPWSTNGLDGSRKWLDRVYRLMIETGKLSDENDHSLDRVYHQTVKKVTDDFEKLGFNTAISQMMIFINECYKAEHVYKEYAENFIKMLSCIAPHICEEMWQQLGHNDSIAYEPWPTYDEKMLVSDTVQMGIQVNGKLRAKIEVAKDADDEAVKELAFQQENVKAHTDSKDIVKVIVVKNKIVNIVVK